MPLLEASPVRPRLVVLFVTLFFTALGLTAMAQSGGLTLQVGSPPPPPTSLAVHSDVWQYHKGTNAAQSGWKTISDGSLDATWASAPGGFGYADNTPELLLCPTVLNDMRNTYATLYLRKTITIPSNVDTNRHLLLTMDWDDGFIAWLDGIYLASSNSPAAPSEPLYTDVATAGHESSHGNSSPAQPVTYDLGALGSQFAPGPHILAILGLNQSLGGSSDFVQVPELQLSSPAGSGTVAGPFSALVQTNSATLSGSNIVAGSTRVLVNGDDAAFSAADKTWSKTQPLSPGLNRLYVAAVDTSGNVMSSTNYLVVSELSSTFVGGAISGNTSWTPAMGIIHVTNQVVVQPGSTLSINPGCVLLLSSGANVMATNSVLTATGSLANPITFLPSDTASTWGGLIASGINANLLLQHVETIGGHVELFDGAAGVVEDSYLHDYQVSSPAIIHTLGTPNHTILDLRRSHISRYYEILCQLSTNHIEDCLCEWQAPGGDGIDFDAGQPGSYIRRCTVRRGRYTNIDALDMGEYNGDANLGSRGVVIESCLLHDFVDKGISMGVAVEVTVTNTLIYGLESGIAVKDNSMAGLFNNTIANCGYGYNCYNKANPASPTGGGNITNSFNNILWHFTSSTLALANGSTLAATYSDFDATNYPGTGNFSSDPLFVNAATGDFRLAAGSPALGSGLNGANLGVTFPVGGVPGAPLNLAALTSGINPVQLTWQDDADNETGFVLERSTDTANWQTVATLPPNTINFSDTTAALGQKYYYRVSAQNDSGRSEVSNVTGATRQQPVINFGGAIASDTLWSAGSTVVVTSSVTVNPGITLTIGAGSMVQVGAGLNIVVANGGRLLAEGTTNAQILFTRSGASGNWGNLTINGAIGSPETRISYARFEFNANNTGTPCIEVNAGTAFLDHLDFGNPAAPYIHVDGASFVISHCYFPTATAAFEPCHGTQGVKSGGHGIFRRNFFGKPNGYNDVVDFTGGNRPGHPLVQFIENVVMGGDDDGFDLDGTDAWVEGNIFLHLHKNGGTPDSSTAVSGGNTSYASGDPGGTGTETSEITVIRNIMFDCDGATDAKQGNFYTFFNNTIVHMSHVGGIDSTGAVLNLSDAGTAEGRGIYLEGNIIYDIEQFTRGLTNAVVTFSNNILPTAWPGPGGGNSVTSPLLSYIPQVAETYFTNWQQAQVMWQWFSLQPGSPGLGTGPNGRDKGAVVRGGASLSGEPFGTTTNRDATLHVGLNRTGNAIPSSSWTQGSGYTAYKWRLDGGSWSAETPINSAITLTALSDGAHKIEAIGKNDADFYQNDSLLAESGIITESRSWHVQGPISLVSPAWTGTDFVFHFVAASGNTYTIQYKTSLSDSAWTKLSDVPAQPTTGDYQVVDPTPGGNARYYRVVSPAQ